jgi:excisionase family DNA binding protein
VCEIPPQLFTWTSSESTLQSEVVVEHHSLEVNVQHPIKTQVLTEKKWLTISEAARYINMSVAFLRKNVRLRTIPHVRIGSKSLRFDRAALDAWIAEGSCGGEVTYDRAE